MIRVDPVVKPVVNPTAGAETSSPVVTCALFAPAAPADRVIVGATHSVQTARREALTSFAWAAALVAGGLWFSFYLWHPLEDFRLMTGARTIQGEIVGTDVEVEDCDSGADCTRGFVGYRFQPAGADWHGGRASFDGGLPPEFQNVALPAPVEIEYLPSDPTVNRLKDAGSTSLGEWLFRLPLWLGLAYLFCSPGFAMFRQARAQLQPQPVSQDDDIAE